MSVLRETCQACGAQSHQPRSLETKAQSVVIESACTACGVPQRRTVAWEEETLERCPVCHTLLMADGGRIGPHSFDWPSRCPGCDLPFVDQRYLYRLRIIDYSAPPVDSAFADLACLNSAIQRLEQRGTQYLSRGPCWQGGSIRLSNAALEVWRRISRAAAPSRKGAGQESHGQARRCQAVA